MANADDLKAAMEQKLGDRTLVAPICAMAIEAYEYAAREATGSRTNLSNLFDGMRAEWRRLKKPNADVETVITSVRSVKDTGDRAYTDQESTNYVLAAKALGEEAMDKAGINNAKL